MCVVDIFVWGGWGVFEEHVTIFMGKLACQH